MTNTKEQKQRYNDLKYTTNLEEQLNKMISSEEKKVVERGIKSVSRNKPMKK